MVRHIKVPCCRCEARVAALQMSHVRMDRWRKRTLLRQDRRRSYESRDKEEAG
jgi:hypothetical protein